jgi:hypothetical protein
MPATGVEKPSMTDMDDQFMMMRRGDIIVPFIV